MLLFCNRIPFTNKILWFVIIIISLMYNIIGNGQSYEANRANFQRKENDRFWKWYFCCCFCLFFFYINVWRAVLSIEFSFTHSKNVLEWASVKWD